jgi:hypothetical protein
MEFFNYQEKPSGKSVIMYGAGNYAGDQLSRWERIGLVPVCFADGNPSLWGTEFPRRKTQSQKYEVLSLSDALKKYPNPDIYITAFYENANEVAKFLVEEKGIPQSSIFIPDDVEFRGGCVELGNWLGIGGHIAKFLFSLDRVRFWGGGTNELRALLHKQFVHKHSLRDISS